MIRVATATEIILANLYKPTCRNVLLADAAGSVLAEPVVADRDFPPFNRVSMDGIAINFDVWQSGQRGFLITATQAAGEAQKKLEDTRTCIEVMTGAILPAGTDTVIRYEDIDIQDATAVVLQDAVVYGQHIHVQGRDAKKDDVLLVPYSILSPAEIALLASVGKADVQVLSFPTLAIVGSGDELVDVHEIPEPHQIRRSNSYALNAAVKAMGGTATLFHLADQKAILLEALTGILAEFDVVILSGGVSKGKFDFIPEVLAELGIKKLFHEVSQRPGKPFWFGVSAEGKTVFALPGNPVSTYMCFYRYIKPWLLKSCGLPLPSSQAILATDFSFQPSLTYFLQVRVKNENGKLMAYPDAGGGSGDFANLKSVTGFLELPLERTDFKAGEAFPYFSFRTTF